MTDVRTFVLSQETACEWIQCILKSGIPTEGCLEPNSCVSVSGTFGAAAVDGLLDFVLPTCDGSTVCTVGDMLVTDVIYLKIDSCTSCGKKVLHYWNLLLNIIPNRTDNNLIRRRLLGCFCAN